MGSARTVIKAAGILDDMKKNDPVNLGVGHHRMRWAHRDVADFSISNPDQP